MSGVSGVSRASRVFAVLDLDTKKQIAFSLAWQAGEKACSFWGDGDLGKCWAKRADGSAEREWLSDRSRCARNQEGLQ